MINELRDIRLALSNEKEWCNNGNDMKIMVLQKSYSTKTRYHEIQNYLYQEVYKVISRSPIEGCIVKLFYYIVNIKSLSSIDNKVMS